MENEYRGLHTFMNDTAKLNAVLEKYPWFTTGRIRRCALTSGADPLLNLNLLTKPWPACLLHETGEIISQEPVSTPDADQIIERFLASGGKRVVPRDDTPMDDAAGDSSVFVPDEEDLDTEELERIYRDQGLELMNDEVSEIMGEVLGEMTEE